MATRIYHWKHGWIPLTHTAALSKAHGSQAGARRELAKSVAAGHAHPSAAKPGAATQGTHVRGMRPVSLEHLPRSNRIIAAHDGRSFSLLQGDLAVSIPEALGDHLHDRGHKIIRLLPSEGREGHKLVVETPEGGVKVFRADGSDRLVVDPNRTELKKTIDRYAKAQGDKAPARPEWAQAHDKLAVSIPSADRELIGKKPFAPDPDEVEAMRQAAIDDAIGYRGGTLEELEAKIKGAQANITNWNALIDAADNHPGIYSAKVWPPELVELAKASGLGRRMPKNALPPLLRALREQETALRRIETNRNLLKLDIDHIKAHDYTKGVRTGTHVDDLDRKTGELGAETAKALKTVKDAGKLVDDQVEQRVTARLAGRTDPRLELPALQKRIDEVNAQRGRAHESGDDAEYDRLTRQLEPLRNQRESLWDSMRSYRQDRNKVYAEEVAQVLAELRPMGGPGQNYVKGAQGHAYAPSGGRNVLEADHAELVGRMRKAEAHYPSSWLKAARDKFGDVELILTSRGYNSKGKLIALSGRGGDGHAPAVHELGHSMELAVPGLSGLEWAFHYSRSSSVKDGRRQLDAPEPVWPNPEELGQRDKWANHYTGKAYHQNGAHGQYEILTTGVEALFAGEGHYFDRPEDMGGDVDVEFRQFMLGVLSVL